MIKKILAIFATTIILISIIALVGCGEEKESKSINIDKLGSSKLETTTTETTSNKITSEPESTEEITIETKSEEPIIDFEGFPTDKEIEEWCKEQYGEAEFIELVSLEEYDTDPDSRLGFQEFYSTYAHKQYKIKDVTDGFEYIVFVYYDHFESKYVIREELSTFQDRYAEEFLKTNEAVLNSLKEKYEVGIEKGVNSGFLHVWGREENKLKEASEEICKLIKEYDKRGYLDKNEIRLIF